MTPRKGKKKYFTSPPHWDGFLYVLSASDPRSLSLLMVQKTQTKYNSKGAHKQKQKKYANDGGSKSDQKHRSKGDQKVTKGSE